MLLGVRTEIHGRSFRNCARKSEIVSMILRIGLIECNMGGSPAPREADSRHSTATIRAPMGATVSKSETIWQSTTHFRNRPWRLLAAFLLAALFAVNVYRAATQSVTHDEATFFVWLLTGS